MARKRVLHADDAPRWRQYVANLLGDRYDVESVNDCDAVLDKFMHDTIASYDLVVLDHLMPGFGPDATGFDVCQRIRRRYPALGVLVYTGAWNDVEVNRRDLERQMGAPVVFKDGDDQVLDDLVQRVRDVAG